MRIMVILSPASELFLFLCIQNTLKVKGTKKEDTIQGKTKKQTLGFELITLIS